MTNETNALHPIFDNDHVARMTSLRGPSRRQIQAGAIATGLLEGSTPSSRGWLLRRPRCPETSD